jgi:hypothetical protein
MYRALFPPLLAGVLALASVSAASAQTVQGRIVDAAGQPVPVALLTLLDTDGRAVRTGLSGGMGTFALNAPAAGRYALRIERIGFATHVTPVFELAAGQTLTLPITVATSPVVLAAIRAETDSRCVVRPEDGSAIAQLWDEARKSLGITAQAELLGVLRKTGLRYTRDLAADDLRQTRVRERRDFNTTGIPFDAVPTRLLARVGFAVRDVDAQTVYLGPSAATLLSDPFLERHCFHRIVEDPSDRSRIGLGFRPVRGMALVGITGTFWLDRATAEVRLVEYEYVDPDPRLGPPASGRIEFARLPSGPSYVSRWRIRMPSQTQHTVGLADPRVLAFVEDGGIVLDVGGEPTNLDDAVLAELNAALRPHPRAYARTVDRVQLDSIAASGAGLVAALRLLGDAVLVETGTFWTREHGPADIVCIEVPRSHGRATPIVADAARARQGCAMVAVLFDGESLDAAGRALRRLDLHDIGAIEYLGTRAAAQRLGLVVEGGVLLLTSRAARSAQAEEAAEAEARAAAGRETSPTSGTPARRIDEQRIDARVLRGDQLEDAIREFDSVQVRRGRFATEEHDARPILCVEPAALQPRTHDGAAFCDMIPVYVDGVRAAEAGTLLRNLRLGDLASIEVLNETDAAFLRGVGGGALVLTTRRGIRVY